MHCTTFHLDPFRKREAQSVHRRFSPSAGNTNSICMPSDTVLQALRLSLRYFLVFSSHRAGRSFCVFASQEVVLGLHSTGGQKSLECIHMTARTWSPIHRSWLLGCFHNRGILLHWQTPFTVTLLPELQRQPTNVDWSKHWELLWEETSQLPAWHSNRRT